MRVVLGTAGRGAHAGQSAGEGVCEGWAVPAMQTWSLGSCRFRKLLPQQLCLPGRMGRLLSPGTCRCPQGPATVPIRCADCPTGGFQRLGLVGEGSAFPSGTAGRGCVGYAQKTQ